MGRLSGKHIVVTGASAGIGAELCRQLGREGCRVTLAARREELLRQVAGEGRRAGGQAELAVADVTDREQVFALARRAEAAFGPIDVWVSNAGAGISHRLVDATEEDMLHLYRLNCLSSLWAYQALLPGWMARGYGQFIDVCSLGGKAGYAYAGAYAAAKHALSGIGDVLRQELALQGVTPGPPRRAKAGATRPWLTVTTVYPGPTISSFGSARFDRIVASALRPPGVDIGDLRRNRNFIVRAVAGPQPTAFVARAIVRAMLRPVCVVYPHRWGTLAVVANHIAPAPLLRAMSRLGR
jgi:NADP-dependent 3-hydroxy acid dehydrogenase YdfG